MPGTRLSSQGSPAQEPRSRPRGLLTSKGATLGKVTSMTSTPGRPWEVRTSPTCRATVPFTWQGTDTRDIVSTATTKPNCRSRPLTTGPSRRPQQSPKNYNSREDSRWANPANYRCFGPAGSRKCLRKCSFGQSWREPSGAVVPAQIGSSHSISERYRPYSAAKPCTVTISVQGGG